MHNLSGTPPGFIYTWWTIMLVVLWRQNKWVHQPLHYHKHHVYTSYIHVAIHNVEGWQVIHTRICTWTWWNFAPYDSNSWVFRRNFSTAISGALPLYVRVHTHCREKQATEKLLNLTFLCASLCLWGCMYMHDCYKSKLKYSCFWFVHVHPRVYVGVPYYNKMVGLQD